MQLDLFTEVVQNRLVAEGWIVVTGITPTTLEMRRS